MKGFIDFYLGAHGKTLFVRIADKDTASRFLRGVSDLSERKLLSLALAQIGFASEDNRCYSFETASMRTPCLEVDHERVTLKASDAFWKSVHASLAMISADCGGHQYFYSVDSLGAPVSIEISLFE